MSIILPLSALLSTSLFILFRSFSVVLFMYCHLVLFSAEFLATITMIALIYTVTGYKPSNSMFENRVIFYVTIYILSGLVLFFVLPGLHFFMYVVYFITPCRICF